MTPSNPDWYEALKGNPLKVKTFTEEMANQIKMKTIASSVSYNRRRALVINSVGLLIVLTIFLFVSGNAEIRSALMWKSMPSNEITAVDTISNVDVDQLQYSKSLTDGEWQRFFDSVQPYRKMIYRENIGDNRMLVFSTNGMRYGQFALRISTFEWTNRQQDQTKGLLEHWLLSGESTSSASPELYEESIFTASGASDGVYSIYYGTIIDPQVIDIKVSSEEIGEKSATLIHDEDGYSYWLIVLPFGINENSKIKIEALDSENLVLETNIL